MISFKIGDCLASGRTQFGRFIIPTILVILVLVIMGSCSILNAGDPGSAVYNVANDKVFWFVHITDVHIGPKGGGDDANTRLSWIVNGKGTEIINPEFIINSGDLTDSTYGSLLHWGDEYVPNGPYVEEWQEYLRVLGLCLNDGCSEKNIELLNTYYKDFYYDLPGNHDHYNDQNFDFFLEWSVRGLLTTESEPIEERTQSSWLVEKPFGTYHFMGVNTTGDDGAGWVPLASANYGDHAGLRGKNTEGRANEIQYIEKELKKHKIADLTIIFGHHPIREDYTKETDTGFEYGAEEFITLLRDGGVSEYGFGHTHKNIETIFTEDPKWKGVFYLNAASLSLSNNDHYNIVAIDNNGISTISANYDQWPVVLITTPIDNNLGGEGKNPYDYPVPASESVRIRALIFSETELDKEDVKFRYYVTSVDEWHDIPEEKIKRIRPINRTGTSHLWEAEWDTSGLSPGEYIIEVSAESGLLVWHFDRITVQVGVEFDLEYRYPISGNIGGIGLSPDDSTLYVAYWTDTWSDKIEWYSAEDPYNFIDYAAYGRCHGDVAISQNNQYIFTTTYYSNNVSRFDLWDNKARTTLPTTSWPQRIAMTPDRSKMVVLSGMDGRDYDMGNDAVHIFDISNGNFSEIATVNLLDEPASYEMAFTDDGAHVYFVTRRKWDGGPAKLHEVSLSSCTITDSASLPSQTCFGIAVAYDKLYISDQDNSMIRVYNRETLMEIETPPWPLSLSNKPGALAIPPNKSGLYVLLPEASGGGALEVLDLNSGDKIAGYEGLGCSGIGDIEFNSDGNKVYISSSSGGVLVLNVKGNPDTDDDDGIGGGGCFIATSAYGSYLDPHVEALRGFRDNYLLTNTLGRFFVSFYYSTSRPIAHYIKEHETLRTATRCLFTPIVYAVVYPKTSLTILITLIILPVTLKKFRPVRLDNCS